MKKIYVDQDVCIGCGACNAIAPDAYEFNDEGLAQVKKDFDFEKVSNDVQNDVMDALLESRVVYVVLEDTQGDNLYHSGSGAGRLRNCCSPGLLVLFCSEISEC